MKLKELYDQLATGELRQVFVGSGAIDTADDSHELPTEAYERIFPLVLAGLTELHKIFLLRESRFDVVLDGRTEYLLGPDFAVSSDSDEAVKYIDDSDTTFQDNLLRVESVWGTYNEKDYEIPLNLTNNDESIRTPSYNILRVPTDSTKAPWLTETTQITVIFRGDHPKISTYKAKTPSRVDLLIPPTHVEALTYYIASRVTNPAGAIGEFHEGNNYWRKFQDAVARLQNQNYDADDEIENMKLVDRGFP